MESKASVRLSTASSSMKKIVKMEVRSDVCLVPKTNEVIYHLLGEGIKNDPAEVY